MVSNMFLISKTFNSKVRSHIIHDFLHFEMQYGQSHQLDVIINGRVVCSFTACSTRIVVPHMSPTQRRFGANCGTSNPLVGGYMILLLFCFKRSFIFSIVLVFLGIVINNRQLSYGNCVFQYIQIFWIAFGNCHFTQNNPINVNNSQPFCQLLDFEKFL